MGGVRSRESAITLNPVQHIKVISFSLHHAIASGTARKRDRPPPTQPSAIALFFRGIT